MIAPGRERLTHVPAGEPRRWKLLRVNPHALPLLLNRGAMWELVEDPLPRDAHLVAWDLERPGGDLIAVVASEFYEEVPPGEPIPPLEESPRFRTTQGRSSQGILA